MKKHTVIIKIFIFFLLLSAVVFVSDLLLLVKSNNPNVLGASTSEEGVAREKVTIATLTSFEQEDITEYEFVPYTTEYEEDPDLEYGVEEVINAGEDGVRTLNYRITHWLGDEIDRVLLSSEYTSPLPEVVRKGTKIVWKEFGTPDQGSLEYWHKMRVFATKYDSSCLGCNNTTALGAPVVQGVCAVDPKVISMYTHFYVPGYGLCQALDVGGLIKGNRIDLAFEDAGAVVWGSGYVDIYLLDNPPY
jgi:3D (Asp-Asp-Asp) domain-containing protein